MGCWRSHKTVDFWTDSDRGRVGVAETSEHATPSPLVRYRARHHVQIEHVGRPTTSDAPGKAWRFRPLLIIVRRRGQKRLRAHLALRRHRLLRYGSLFRSVAERRLRRRDRSEAPRIQITSAFTETLLTLTLTIPLPSSLGSQETSIRLPVCRRRPAAHWRGTRGNSTDVLLRNPCRRRQGRRTSDIPLLEERPSLPESHVLPVSRRSCSTIIFAPARRAIARMMLSPARVGSNSFGFARSPTSDSNERARPITGRSPWAAIPRQHNLTTFGAGY